MHYLNIHHLYLAGYIVCIKSIGYLHFGNSVITSNDFLGHEWDASLMIFVIDTDTGENHWQIGSLGAKNIFIHGKPYVSHFLHDILFFKWHKPDESKHQWLILPLLPSAFSSNSILRHHTKALHRQLLLHAKISTELIFINEDHLWILISHLLVFTLLHKNMGQVMRVRLSCYLVLLSSDNKTS